MSGRSSGCGSGFTPDISKVARDLRARVQDPGQNEPVLGEAGLPTSGLRDESRDLRSPIPDLRRGSARFRSRGGFALIITISLLAFLVLLLVVLASLTRVETGISRNTQDLARAKQNALVGLNVALGALQKAAGPDQRVTATADLIGATNSHWTGVWDTTNMAAAPVWLVSGAAPNPNSAATGEVLVGTNTAGSVAGTTVTVPTEDITVDSYPGLAGNQTIGKFAWWVGDEGVKGRLDIRDTVDSVTIPGSPAADDPVTSAADRDRLRQLYQHRAGGDALPTFGLADETTSAARWNGLANVLTYNQLKFLFATTTTQRNYLRDNFHDYTAASAGLLANSSAGGLRSNLSDPTSPLSNAGITDLEAFRPSAGNVINVAPGVAPLASPAAQVKPLITEFTLDVVLYREDLPPFGGNSGRLLMGYRVRAEFWNPYLLPIQHNPAGSADYLVKFTGLPKVTVTAPLQAPSNVGGVDLGAAIGGATTVPIDFDAPLVPGQFTWRVSALVQDRDTGLTIPDATVPSSGVTAADDRIDFAAPASTVTVEFYSVNNPTVPIARFENIAVPAFSRAGSVNWWIAGNLPFPTVNNTTNLVNLGMSIHLRADTSTAHDTWEEWVNPPSGPYPPDLRFPSILYDTNFWESIGADPVDSAQQSGSAFNAADPVFAFNKPRVAFDFPVQRQFSVGDLSMMSFPSARPLAVGSPWGGVLNAAFDSMFFNPVQSSWAVGQPLPNTRNTPIAAPVTGAAPTAADLRNADAAKFLTVAGAFNVNSTSTNAWTVLLGRAVRGWQPVTGAAKTLENPFFQLGHSAQLGDPAVTGFPILGKRTFSDTTIQMLAAEIRRLILIRGRPFASLEEFVNSGILQTAINSIGLNNAGAGTADIGGSAPDPYTPNYLTQGGVLNTLAPVLAARSDTFTIRAFGSVINPVTNTESGRAWCEAVVQRVPELVDPAAGSVMNNATGLGRRFKIVQFRWLNADDI